MIYGDLPTLKQNIRRYSGYHDTSVCEYTALIHATHENNPQCVAFLTRFESGLTDHLKYPALFYAVYYRHLECIPFLITESKLRDAAGQTALHLACSKNKFESAKYLLAGVGVANNDGMTPLQIAQQKNSKECIQIIENYKKDKMFRVCDKDDWFIAVKASYIDSVKKYYQQYKSERTDNGESALQLVAYYNHQDCVEYLMQSELKLVDNEGRTALMRASSRDCVECIPFLLSEINILDNRGNDALFYASLNECFESAKLLLKEICTALQNCVKILNEQIRDTIKSREKEEDEIMRIVVVLVGE